MSAHLNSRGDSSLSTDLAEQMASVLRAQRELGSDAYPLTLKQLGQLADADASATDIARAANKDAFKSSAIVARKQELAAPVALLEDAKLLAQSPQTLRYALDVCSEKQCKAHTVVELKKKLTGRAINVVREGFQQVNVEQNRFQPIFQQAVERQMADGDLPPDVGFVSGGKGVPRLFCLSDLQPAAWRDAIHQPRSAMPAEDKQQATRTAPLELFSQLFATAFQQLDREAGGYNFVSLAELRSKLCEFSREDFDAQLRELRLARHYRLSGAENRSDVSPEQRAAGIKEAGSLLLYAQRIQR